MSIFTTGKIGNVVRGGQTTTHFIRMIAQVGKSFIFISLLLAAITYCVIFWFSIDAYEKQLSVDYSRAWLHAELFNDGKTMVSYHSPSGKLKQVKAASIVNNANVKLSIAAIKDKSIASLYMTALAGVVIVYLLMVFIYKTGQSHKKDEHIRGGLLVKTKALKKSIRTWLKQNKETLGTLAILDIILPKKFEPAHILIAGDPGTGKSNLLRKSFQSIRDSGQRAIIYDRSGDFVKNFYRPGIDQILNPMDVRSATWDIFRECKKEHEFFQLATSFIPDVKSNDPFWTSSARIIFSSMAMKEAQTAAPTVARLVNNMTRLTLEEMIEYCEGTDAQAIITKGGEKMAISIRGVLVTYIRALKYLPPVEDDGFSIKDWTQDDDSDSWIFITSNKSIHDTIKPLITSWLDIATASILSLEPDLNRRIWLVIDELPTLNKLPAIQTTPAESRKYGGCFIIGFQNYPQLLDIYGKNGTDALCGSCSTAVIFRCNELTFAKWASDQLGRAELIETSEGISYGVNEIRDGVNLGKQRKERAVVLPTELQQLPDMQGYIKLGRGFPVASFTDKWQDYQTVAKGYIESDATMVAAKVTTKATTQPKAIAKAPPVNEPITADEEAVIIDDSPQAVYLDSWANTTPLNQSAKPRAQPKDAWQVNTKVSLSAAKPVSQSPALSKEASTATPAEHVMSKPASASGFIRPSKKKPTSTASDDDSSNKSNAMPQADAIDIDNDIAME